MPAKPPEENAPVEEHNFPDGYQYGIHDVGYEEPTPEEKAAKAKEDKAAKKDAKEEPEYVSTIRLASEVEEEEAAKAAAAEEKAAKKAAKEEGASTPKANNGDGGN